MSGVTNQQAATLEHVGMRRHLLDVRVRWDLHHLLGPVIGMYVNSNSEDGGERAREVYGESKFRRLSELKTQYDPENVLRVNQNIKPG